MRDGEKPKKVKTLQERQAGRVFHTSDVDKAIEIMRRGHHLKLEGRFWKFCGGVIPTKMALAMKGRIRMQEVGPGEWSA